MIFCHAERPHIYIFILLLAGADGSWVSLLRSQPSDEGLTGARPLGGSVQPSGDHVASPQRPFALHPNVQVPCVPSKQLHLCSSLLVWFLQVHGHAGLTRMSSIWAAIHISQCCWR